VVIPAPRWAAAAAFPSSQREGRYRPADYRAGCGLLRRGFDRHADRGAVSQQQTTTQRSISPQEEKPRNSLRDPGDTEDTWGAIFEKMGRQYPQPKLVMYRGATRTGCGTGKSVMGPFYCPADSTVYIDLSFYDEMKTSSARTAILHRAT
jgi:predicted metalloprotease